MTPVSPLERPKEGSNGCEPLSRQPQFTDSRPKAQGAASIRLATALQIAVRWYLSWHRVCQTPPWSPPGAQYPLTGRVAIWRA